MLDALKRTFTNYYTNFEEFVTRNEANEDVKINKKMLIFYTHILAAYFTLIYLFNPSITLSRFLGLQLYVLSQFVALLSRNYPIMAGFYIFTALASLYGCSVNPYDGLKSIAIALIQHNYSFLLNKSKSLKLIFVIVSMALVHKSQLNVQEVLDQGDFETVKQLILNLQYSWPTLYLINTVSILYLTNKYWQAFQWKQEAQKALELKNQELSEVNHRLQATLRLLEQANKELKDAMSARELFIASVSHELRNPLNSMLGNIELLSLDIKEPKYQNMLDSCKICGEVLLGLINNVLDVAKINAEKLELHIESENLHRVIEKVWMMSTIKMRQKGIEGHLLIENNVPKYVEIDAHRLNQILLNLIGNATKFTQGGFVRVIVSWIKDGDIEQINESNWDLIPTETQSSSRIDLKTDIIRHPQVRMTKNQETSSLQIREHDPASPDKRMQDNILRRFLSPKTFSDLKSVKYTHFDESDTKIQQKLIGFSPRLNQNGILKIEIIDSGCGIAASNLKRLFHPFSQADPSVTARFGGTGLGLYITKQLVEKMGGQIHVQSHQNVGSKFWIGIPAHSSFGHQNEIRLEDINKTMTKNLNNMLALIVDDDPFNQLILENYLSKLSIQSEAVRNGQEALEKFKSKRANYYSFIITDIEMPGMDGLSACKAIRRYEQQIKRATCCPIAIVTANSSDLERRQCLDPNGEIKAHSYFRKPFTFEECKAFTKNLIYN